MSNRKNNDSYKSEYSNSKRRGLRDDSMPRNGNANTSDEKRQSEMKS